MTTYGYDLWIMHLNLCVVCSVNYAYIVDPTRPRIFRRSAEIPQDFCGIPQNSAEFPQDYISVEVSAEIGLFFHRILRKSRVLRKCWEEVRQDSVCGKIFRRIVSLRKNILRKNIQDCISAEVSAENCRRSWEVRSAGLYICGKKFRRTVFLRNSLRNIAEEAEFCGNPELKLFCAWNMQTPSWKLTKIFFKYLHHERGIYSVWIKYKSSHENAKEIISNINFK